MKIKDSLYKPIQPFEGPKPEDAARNRKDSGKVSPDGDQVNFSEHARDLARTLKAATEADDVRPEKVAELKERVRSGAYQPDSRETADKLLGDELDLLL
jgi:negative regulator of flagellin synthesis FlgM